MQGVDTVYAVHCDPSLDVGEIGLREGPLTAAADQVTVTLRGRGGHTSRPFLTGDLTYALAKVVTDVPAVLSRRVDPRSGLVVVWGRVSAGEAINVIPSTGVAQGTLRMLDIELWEKIGPLLHEVVDDVVRPYGVDAAIEHIRGVPPVVNDTGAVAALGRASWSTSARPAVCTRGWRAHTRSRRCSSTTSTTPRCTRSPVATTVRRSPCRRPVP